MNMPYAPVAGPSLGLGLLQSVLQQTGITATTVYANILWCETIGLHLYDIGSNLTHLFGEWIFAHVAFPESHPDCESYLDAVFQPGTLKRLGINRREVPEFIAILREEATRFIDDTVDRIIGYRPLFVGCSSTFVGHVSSLALLKRVKAIAPHIVTVMGGANCESVMGLTTHEQFTWVDYVVSGEADTIMVALARGIEQYGRDMALADVPDGVIAPVHRTMGYQGLRDKPPRAVTSSLDELPIPNYGEYFSASGSSSHTEPSCEARAPCRRFQRMLVGRAQPVRILRDEQKNAHIPDQVLPSAAWGDGRTRSASWTGQLRLRGHDYQSSFLSRFLPDPERRSEIVGSWI